VVPSLDYAQGSFPNRPVKIVVPYAAGGPNDTTFRLIGGQLEPIWKQPVIIEARPGANGRIAYEAVAKAPADGYTLVNIVSSMLTMPFLIKDLSFDPLRDLTGIANVLRYTTYIAISDDIPAKTLPDFVSYVKSHPGKISFGTQGQGNVTHLTQQIFLDAYKLDAVAIHYPGTPQMIGAVLRGEVQMVNTSELQMANTHGKLHPIASINDSRLPDRPDVPTLKETGLFDFVPFPWIALGGPTGVPQEVIVKIATDVGEVVKNYEFASKLLKASGASSVYYLGPDQLNQLMKSEYANWGKVIKRLDIKPQ
jgi:tripartite-type tricarboxylate transporter receptor subunit TctC